MKYYREREPGKSDLNTSPVPPEEILKEVITVPEAIAIAATHGKKFDKTNLCYHLRRGRMISRKEANNHLIWKDSFLLWLKGFPYSTATKLNDTSQYRCPHCEEFMEYNAEHKDHCPGCNIYPEDN